MRDQALGLVPQQPEIEGYVVQADGDRRNESRDIEPTWSIYETGQDEHAQGRGGKMGDFIE